MKGKQLRKYSQLTSKYSCFSVRPKELFASQMYIPVSSFPTFPKINSAVLAPELFTFPLWIHLTSGSGLPVALQLMLISLPSLSLTVFALGCVIFGVSEIQSK